MFRKLPVCGVVALFGLLASAACSSSSSDDGTAGATSGGSGGTGGKGSAGSSSGKGGTGGRQPMNNAGNGGTTPVAKGGAAGLSEGGNPQGGNPQGGNPQGESGAGGESGAAPDSQCPSCPSGFCFLDKTCVECLPEFDNCPEGKVCGSSNTCVPGCKEDGTSCASGVCKDAHNCLSCLGDAECGGGYLCGDNRCSPACTADQEGTSAGCGAGHTCCSAHCVDEQTDGQHCGACGTSCDAGEFCGLSACSNTGAAGAGGESGAGNDACVACHPTTIANICAVPRIAVVLDGQIGNETPGRALGAALVAQCSPAPILREVSQTVPDALNPASGRPLSGAHELLVAAGGSIYARLLGYLDSQKVSPIYWYYDQQDTIEFRKSSNDEAVISRKTSEPNEDHDFFVIQLMRDPSSGSLILNAEGFWLSGTVAATFFFEHGMLPNLSNFNKSWYVYEWTDKNEDKKPDLDEMSEVASG